MMQQSLVPAGSTAGRRSGTSRFAWFGAALGVFAVSSFLAFRQQPRMDAFARPSPLTADWWFHPIDRNAPRRLPLVWGNLNDVFALRGTGKVWVVGEGGLVLHSEDYGRHWMRQYLVLPESSANPAGAARLRWFAPVAIFDSISLLAITTNTPSSTAPLDATSTHIAICRRGRSIDFLECACCRRELWLGGGRGRCTLCDARWW